MISISKATSLDHEFRIRNADDEWIWLRARAELITGPDDACKHLVGLAVDVTEQKAQAEHAQMANIRLRDAVDSISEAFVLWDSQNRLVTCNSKFLDLHGLTMEDAPPGAAYPQIMAHATAPSVQAESVLDGDGCRRRPHLRSAPRRRPLAANQ